MGAKHGVDASRGGAGAILCALAFLALCAPTAEAQYFGRNKVQYHNFDFSILTTDHFSIYHYPGGSEAVQDAARMLESWYAKHSATFGIALNGKQKVIIYNNATDFQQANAVPGLLSQGEGGVTESEGNRIVLYLTGVYGENSHVLGHELVHAFQYKLLETPGLAAEAAPSLPLWFIEGMAEYYSKPQPDSLTDMWMRDAVLNKDVPDIGALSTSPDKYFPYRFGEAVWAFEFPLGHHHRQRLLSRHRAEWRGSRDQGRRRSKHAGLFRRVEGLRVPDLSAPA